MGIRARVRVRVRVRFRVREVFHYEQLTHARDTFGTHVLLEGVGLPLDGIVDGRVRQLEGLLHDSLRLGVQPLEVGPQVVLHGARRRLRRDAAVVAPVTVEHGEEPVVLVDLDRKVRVLVLLGTVARAAAVRVLPILDRRGARARRRAARRARCGGRSNGRRRRLGRRVGLELVVVVGVRLDLLYLIRCGGRRRHHSSGRWLPGRRRHHLRLLRRRGRRRRRRRRHRHRRGLRYLGGLRPFARAGRGGGSTEAPCGERERHRRGGGVARGGELGPAELHVQLPEHELVPRRCRLRQQVGQSQRDLQCTQCSTVHAERHGSVAALGRECAGLMRAPKRAAQAHAALGSRVRPKPAAISSSL